MNQNQSSTLIAQVPANGASRASDFQPTAQNPQTGVTGVQQQGGLQDVGNPQEVLGAQNAQISVPSNRNSAQAVQKPVDAGGSALMWWIVGIALVSLFLAHFHFRNKKRRLSEANAPIMPTIPAPAPTPPQKSKKKSKKKRKKRR